MSWWRKDLNQWLTPIGQKLWGHVQDEFSWWRLTRNTQPWVLFVFLRVSLTKFLLDDQVSYQTFLWCLLTIFFFKSTQVYHASQFHKLSQFYSYFTLIVDVWLEGRWSKPIRCGRDGKKRLGYGGSVGGAKNFESDETKKKNPQKQPLSCRFWTHSPWTSTLNQHREPSGTRAAKAWNWRHSGQSAYQAVVVHVSNQWTRLCAATPKPIVIDNPLAAEPAHIKAFSPLLPGASQGQLCLRRGSGARWTWSVRSRRQFAQSRQPCSARDRYPHRLFARRNSGPGDAARPPRPSPTDGKKKKVADGWGRKRATRLSTSLLL